MDKDKYKERRFAKCWAMVVLISYEIDLYPTLMEVLTMT